MSAVAVLLAGSAAAEEPTGDTIVVSMATPAIRPVVRTEVPALHRGQVLVASGDVVGALSHLREAVTDEVGSLRSLRTLGQALLLAGELEEAEQVLHRAASVEPGDADTVELLAIARFQRGNLDGAASMFERVLRDHPDRAVSLVGAARCAVERGDAAVAVEWTERAVELDAPGAMQLHLTAMQRAGMRRQARQLRRQLRRSGQIVD